jgi:hypothetical protein
MVSKLLLLCAYHAVLTIKITLSLIKTTALFLQTMNFTIYQKIKIPWLLFDATNSSVVYLILLLSKGQEGEAWELS